MKKWILFLCCVTISACKTSKNIPEINSNIESSEADKFAKERFGDNYIIVNNPADKYSLVQSKTKTFAQIGFDVSYFIFDIQAKEIITEDHLNSGHVEWIDEHIIKAVDRGQKEDKNRKKTVYLYNAQTREKKEM